MAIIIFNFNMFVCLSVLRIHIRESISQNSPREGKCTYTWANDETARERRRRRWSQRNTIYLFNHLHFFILLIIIRFVFISSHRIYLPQFTYLSIIIIINISLSSVVWLPYLYHFILISFQRVFCMPGKEKGNQSQRLHEKTLFTEEYPPKGRSRMAGPCGWG